MAAFWLRILPSETDLHSQSFATGKRRRHEHKAQSTALDSHAQPYHRVFDCYLRTRRIRVPSAHRHRQDGRREQPRALPTLAHPPHHQADVPGARTPTLTLTASPT